MISLALLRLLMLLMLALSLQPANLELWLLTLQMLLARRSLLNMSESLTL